MIEMEWKSKDQNALRKSLCHICAKRENKSKEFYFTRCKYANNWAGRRNEITKIFNLNNQTSNKSIRLHFYPVLHFTVEKLNAFANDRVERVEADHKKKTCIWSPAKSINAIQHNQVTSTARMTTNGRQWCRCRWRQKNIKSCSLSPFQVFGTRWDELYLSTIPKT